MLKIDIPPCPIQTVVDTSDTQIDILREDLNHSIIQGNKLRKLKYNLIEAKNAKTDTLVTFGGAYSNHILATAGAGMAYGFKTVGVIRGEELQEKELNPTLSKSKEFGMHLDFITRSDYRKKTEKAFIDALSIKYPSAYLLPEGGTNELAVRGCEEILDHRTKDYDIICLPVGTAGTISGVIRASLPHQIIWGFPALKNADFLKEEIVKYTQKSNYDFINAYHFGGYARFCPKLIKFVNKFYQDFKIPLDPVYNGKMVYGIMDMLNANRLLKGKRILVIHTGGLQGIEGFNRKSEYKIKVDNL